MFVDINIILKYNMTPVSFTFLLPFFGFLFGTIIAWKIVYNKNWFSILELLFLGLKLLLMFEETQNGGERVQKWTERDLNLMGSGLEAFECWAIATFLNYWLDCWALDPNGFGAFF